ncbi:Uma2 family endonuclease [Crocosphaera sp. XPORK-15E]|uniref:Uma2 family endonuclease n=1 Tax=Crocosphaera sp. XPORK-15E TaxID=3110247 RepID=UPI002B1F2975|nr:Uma2 family endonuclease [Crocosphaera sp. XPORK-15E]MEA5535727.1 Uma2 family endonuclease [Crocosphaera sp. XPORK-15E]
MSLKTTVKPKSIGHKIIWETLPDDFELPDEPVDNLTQPLLAAVLREILEIAGLIRPEMLIATNFGICTKVDGKTAIKAPDLVYIPQVKSTEKERKSYTPYTDGDLPVIVMEFISETEGGEYSINPHYPYGKWYFYEQILKIPVYIIFHPLEGILECYRLVEGHYQAKNTNDKGYYWLEEINLFLGVWQGTKADRSGYWLRWWDSSGNLLLWGTERIEQEKQEKEILLKKLKDLSQRLKEMGIEPEVYDK